MLINRQKISSLITLAIIAYFVFANCNKEESQPATKPNIATASNKNCNTRVYQHLEDDETLNVTEVAQRLEIPKIEEHDLFIVHSVSDLTCYTKSGTVQLNEGLNYCMAYDTKRKAARWAAFMWNKNNTVIGWTRKQWPNGDPFQEDPLLPKEYRTTLEQHKANDYDRGHIIASQDRICNREMNEQTFYLSNMFPQIPALNQRGLWYNLENRLRDVYNTDEFRETLYVVKGGTIGKGQYNVTPKGLVVPKYFYMALLCRCNQTENNGYKAIAFWIKHSEGAENATDYAGHAISIDKLEEKTGIDFFCNLPDNIEKAVESEYNPKDWDF